MQSVMDVSCNLVKAASVSMKVVLSVPKAVGLMMPAQAAGRQPK